MTTPKTRKAEPTAAKMQNGAHSPETSLDTMIGWPIDAWLRCQVAVINAAQPVAAGWIERRREGATAALDTFARLASCSDLQEAASIHREWLEGTMRRLDADFHAIADHAVAVSNEAVTATRYAAQSSSEAMSRAAAPVFRHDDAIEQAA